ncbi:MAG: metallophosphoesterase [Ignavibacteria bacterium]|nr:metallophosphoesterase [Ignavibacteria bacterium]
MLIFKRITWVELIGLALPLAAAPLTAQTSIRFAAFGDYGETSRSEALDNLVDSLNPDFIITTGDNSYGSIPIDDQIGRYYSDYIGSYAGAYGSGSTVNRFFPSLGSHDYNDGGGLNAYLAYFTLPDTGILNNNTSGNERYYDYVRGPVHFFVINSYRDEPDGLTNTSTQAQWLQAQLAASTSPWKLVYMHHPPYSSGEQHGSTTVMQWSYEDWGATAVLAGHDHTYERLIRDDNNDSIDFPYFVTGLGARVPRVFNSIPESGSVVRYNADNGTMLIEANLDSIAFEFYSVEGNPGGTLIDSYTIIRGLMDTILVQVGSTWKYLDDGSDQGTAWRGVTFDDALWSSGPAELGYGDGDEVTVVNCGPNAPFCEFDNFITTYFRHSFEVANTSVFTSLALSVLSDDGAVVYLNGTEIFRTNMPPGTITYTTLASSAIFGAAETTFDSTTIAPGDLRNGANVLAVEVHQWSSTNPDNSFDLRIVGSTFEDPVPIQLGSFSAVVVSQTEVQLDWMTLTETNNYGFEMQKSENTPENYETIPHSFVPGHGTTIVPHYYSYTDITASPGHWYYRLKQIDLDGTVNYSDGVEVDILTPVEEGLTPLEFALLQNYPNPFNPSTEIKFSVEKTSWTTLHLYNILGQSIATLFDDIAEAGKYHRVKVDGTNLASGLYVYKLQSGVKTQVKKMLLLK